MDFEEYIRQGEPQMREKGYAWQTAIGLQAVDGLKPSAYLLETARKDIEGDISIDEAEQLIKSYYRSKAARTPEEEGQREADMASANIRRLLTEQTFAFSLVGLTSIHRRIFKGVFKFAGEIRSFNITKKEWVLRGDTVLYVSAPDIRRAIEYDLAQERQFDYAGVDRIGMISHIAQFVSNLWQIHPFAEGNTRTTAVFAILYLRSMGFDVTNDMFANHAWYFRNALVRANYQNVQKGIMRDTGYLERFFRNLLLGEDNELRNRYMIVPNPNELSESQPIYKTDRTTTVQVTEQVRALLRALSDKQLSLKVLMGELGLKHRPTFMVNYLNPALGEGFVQALYSQPNHPRQKYLLTAKGLALLNEVREN